MPIDMIELARFASLPGADRIVRSYSRVPEGKLRDSIIAHVEAMAETYDDARAQGAPIPDPLIVAAQAFAAPALPAPGQRKPRILDDSPEARVIALRKEGKLAKFIARELKMSRLAVDDILAAARKGGLKFKRIARSPEERATTGFVMTMDEVSSTTRGRLETAALKFGKSLEGYVEARAAFVAMRREEKPMDEIAEAVGIPEKTLWQWLYSARRAGIDLVTNVTYEDAIVEPVAPPERSPPAPKASHHARGYWFNVSELSAQQMTSARRAAEALGVDLVGYGDLRRKALALFRLGRTPAAVSAVLGIGLKQAGNWKDRARAAGLLKQAAA